MKRTIKEPVVKISAAKKAAILKAVVSVRDERLRRETAGKASKGGANAQG